MYYTTTETICSNAVGAAAKTAPINHLKPPLQISSITIVSKKSA